MKHLSKLVLAFSLLATPALAGAESSQGSHASMAAAAKDAFPAPNSRRASVHYASNGTTRSSQRGSIGLSVTADTETKVEVRVSTTRSHSAVSSMYKVAMASEAKRSAAQKAPKSRTVKASSSALAVPFEPDALAFLDQSPKTKLKRAKR
jgi:hypothetical protein